MKKVKSLVRDLIVEVLLTIALLGVFYLIGMIVNWAEQHIVLFLIITSVINGKLILDEINK